MDFGAMGWGCQASSALSPGILPEGKGALRGNFGAKGLGLSGFKRTLTLALSQRERGCSDRLWRVGCWRVRKAHAWLGRVIALLRCLPKRPLSP